MYITLKSNKNLQIMQQDIDKMGLKNCSILNSDSIMALFPYLHVDRDSSCLWQSNQAGCISPRKLVAAQQAIAKSRGCEVIDDTVVSIKELKSASGADVMQISCEAGRKLLTKRVLLCTGAFTNFNNLLPHNKQIEFHPCTTIVVKVEVTEEYAKEKADMPSMVLRLPNKEVYILPPIKYPDGEAIWIVIFIRNKFTSFWYCFQLWLV